MKKRNDETMKKVIIAAAGIAIFFVIIAAVCLGAISVGIGSKIIKDNAQSIQGTGKSFDFALEFDNDKFSKASTDVESEPTPALTPIITSEPISETTISPTLTPIPTQKPKSNNKIIVIDPGHGKSSSSMTKDEKIAAGWVYNEKKGKWGEWRHWKSGEIWHDCEGSGCTGRAPKNGSCWYSISSSDRSVEPDINLKNALAAKKYLEKLGYTVRMTRTTNDENPSMSKRLEKCYANGNIKNEPDADAYICLHSNAGGGRGSYYIALNGKYDQAGIPSTFISDSNKLGKSINDSIVENTSLRANSGGVYNGYPELVLFNKTPIIIAYMEIGFFDNESDLSILKSEYDDIGKAIAEGIDKYFQNI